MQAPHLNLKRKIAASDRKDLRNTRLYLQKRQALQRKAQDRGRKSRIRFQITVFHLKSAFFADKYRQRERFLAFFAKVEFLKYFNI